MSLCSLPGIALGTAPGNNGTSFFRGSPALDALTSESRVIITPRLLPAEIVEPSIPFAALSSLGRLPSPGMLPISASPAFTAPDRHKTGQVQRAWGMSVGKSKLFNLEHVSSSSIQDIAATMSDSSFMLTRGQHVDNIDIPALTAHLSLLALVFDVGAAETRARSAAADFSFPPEVESRDRDLLRSLGSIVSVISHVQSFDADMKFNASRVDECIDPSYPEFGLLRSIADTGAVIVTPAGFLPSGAPEKPRPIMRRLPNVIRAQAFKSWSKGRGVLIKLSELSPADLAMLHFNPVTGL